MSTITYMGSISEATGLNNSPSVSLSGSGTASGILNSITALLTFSTNAYGNYYDVTATLYYTGGNTSASSSIKMDSSNYTAGQFSFTFSGLTVDQANSITAVAVSCSSNANKIFLKGSQTVTVDYTPVGAVTAPTKLTLSATSVAPGARVTLSWSGAAAGENNDIAGYNIYRSASAGGNYSLLASVSSTATNGSTVVTAPTTNGSAYYYKVSTVGARDGYDSSMSVSYTTLTCSFDAVCAPTSVSLSATNAAPGAELTLSWSGASGGDNNSIAGYQVYRSTSAEGSYSLLSSVTTTATSGSTTVTAPTENNASYYYKVLTVGTLDGYNSDLSSVYARLTCTFSTPSAPSTVTIAGGASTYASPGSKVTLAWSGATAGANNPITGYTVYRDGVVYASNLAKTVSSLEVIAHATAGNAYSYTVVTLGKQSNSAPSLARVVYAYTDPTAPTTLTVSDSTSSAGGRVTLSWAGAKAGGYNNIVGYRVYRAVSTTGAKTQVAYVPITTTSGSCYVSVPSTVGSYYYFWVETIGSYSVSGVSTVFATVYTSAEQEDESDDTVVIVPPPSRRKKRGFVFGDYDTAANGWTLTGWEFSEPEPQTSYVSVPGRMKGPLDLSTALTDGDPRYGSRELTAIFENSEGTRLERDEIISTMTNLLHGVEVEIVFPDDPSRYAVGRLSVRLNYSDMAHAEVSIQAVCEPWRYNQQETQINLMVIEDESSTVLSNTGRCVLVPEVQVVGAGSRVSISSGENSWTLTEGVYRLPDLTLRKGNTFIKYSGIGTLVFKYREAIL